jgi:hypothetical protein
VWLENAGHRANDTASVEQTIAEPRKAVRRGPSRYYDTYKLMPNVSGTDWTVDDSASDAANAAANSVVRIH